MTQTIDKRTIVKAPPSTVWNALTNPDVMKRWMAEPEMEIEIITDWKVGHPIVIKGFHHTKFENKGTVLQFEPGKVLQYNHLSSLSRLPDEPENYSIITFRLAPLKDHTSLTLSLSKFPAEGILKHLDFYWGTTLEIMKKFIEKQMPLAHEKKIRND